MGQCVLCGRCSDEVSASLGLCAECILADTPAARDRAVAVHTRSREKFGLPAKPPRHADGARCGRCVNACRIGAGQIGYCGVRANDAGTVVGGDADAAAVQWHDDPLPTNCVAAWLCPASGPGGYPDFTRAIGPERGSDNLAVFYQACSFDCLFCQNWRFKEHSIRGPRRPADELVDSVKDETRCICYFGGDPTCQMDHALASAREARRRSGDEILRICWETNGSMSHRALQAMVAVSVASGGCIKFDLKAWDDSLHRALCGVSNRRTLRNFEYLCAYSHMLEPPLLVASTPLVPGYVDAVQVGRIARFIADLDSGVPYSLLAFHPAFEMNDLPTTSRRQAMDCLAAAEDAGLTRVRIGNEHLLS